METLLDDVKSDSSKIYAEIYTVYLYENKSSILYLINRKGDWL